jgi:hypothetical protein
MRRVRKWERMSLTIVAYVTIAMILFVRCGMVAGAAGGAPPDAQDPLQLGIAATGQKEWLLAARYFQDARRASPNRPDIFFNLGMAESQIPGRELRAICWFGAYLSALPDAPNSEEVKKNILELTVRNQASLANVIQMAHDAARKQANPGRALLDVVSLWVMAGDLDRAFAIATCDAVKEAGCKESALWHIASGQVGHGDISDAQRIADRIQGAESKCSLQAFIAEAQFEAGDVAAASRSFAAALKTAGTIGNLHGKGSALGAIARTQARTGDVSGALRTAATIEDVTQRNFALADVAAAEAKAGDLTGASKTANAIQDAEHKARVMSIIEHAALESIASLQPGFSASSWIERLDDGSRGSICPLNSSAFLDLDGCLKSLPVDDTPNYFRKLHYVALELITAQRRIDTMLKRQAEKT